MRNSYDHKWSTESWCSCSNRDNLCDKWYVNEWVSLLCELRTEKIDKFLLKLMKKYLLMLYILFGRREFIIRSRSRSITGFDMIRYEKMRYGLTWTSMYIVQATIITMTNKVCIIASVLRWDGMRWDVMG